MDHFYIYVWFCPVSGVPRYVGKGHENRYDPVRRFNRIDRVDNPRLRSFLIKTRGKVPCVIIRDDLEEDDAFALERLFISVIGRGRNGPLLNISDGGEGSKGYRWTEEQLKNRPSITPFWSDSSRKAVGEFHRNRKRTDEEKLKMKASWTTQRKAENSERVKALWTDERRQAVSERNKYMVWTEEMRQKISSANTPERRKAASERMKAYHERKRKEKCHVYS